MLFQYLIEVVGPQHFTQTDVEPNKMIILFYWSIVPQYLQGKGCFDHNLWNGFIKNKSIVFQPNIGWSNDFLSNRLVEIGGSPLHKSYYEKTRDYYSLLVKKL